jgi:D-sedoheptulose 7-phosphate isomerase
MRSITKAASYFRMVSSIVTRLPYEAIDQVAEVLVRTYDAGRTVYLFGNGGSAALASHMACDLGKGTVNGSQKRFRITALTDNVPLITAWANDSCYEEIFSQQIENYASPGDVAFAISGSGNSPNVLNALRAARRMGAITVGIGGFQGGRMKELCDFCIVVPCDNMQIIEDLHVCISHALFTCIRSRLQEMERQCA